MKKKKITPKQRKETTANAKRSYRNYIHYLRQTFDLAIELKDQNDYLRQTILTSFGEVLDFLRQHYSIKMSSEIRQAFASYGTYRSLDQLEELLERQFFADLPDLLDEVIVLPQQEQK